MTDLLSAEAISAIKPVLQHAFEDLLKSKGDTSLTNGMQKIIKDDF